MSEQAPETTQSDLYTSNDSDNKVAIIAIVATAFVVLACIAACTVVAYAFLINAPWQGCLKRVSDPFNGFSLGSGGEFGAGLTIE